MTPWPSFLAGLIESGAAGLIAQQIQADIDIFLALYLIKSSPDSADVELGRDGDNSLHSKDGSSTPRSEVGLGLHRFDIDREIAEHAADAVDHPRMIHAGGRQSVGQLRTDGSGFRGTIEKNRKTRLTGQFVVLLGDFVNVGCWS